MKQRLADQSQKRTNPLVDFINNKLNSTPSRRTLIKGLLLGTVAGIGLSQGQQAYASHAPVTSILDSGANFPFTSMEEYAELENISAVSVIAPSAGRGKIFRNSADDKLYVKYPDDSIVDLEAQGISDHGGLGGLGDDDHTQYILVTGTRAFTGAPQIVSSDAKIIFDDTGEADPLGEYNILSNNDIFSIEGRNAGDDAFEDIITIERIADGGLVDFRGSDGIAFVGDTNLKRMEANILGTDDDFWVKGEQLYFGADKLSLIDRNAGSFRFFTDFNSATAQRRGTLNRFWSEVAFEFETMYLQQKNVAKPNAVADHSSLYAKDVASSSEMFVVDEADNETQISPHNFTMFTPDLSLPYPWSYYSKNDFLGVELSVDMAQLVKDIEGLTGKSYTTIRNYAKASWDNSQDKIKDLEDNIRQERAQEVEDNRRKKLVEAQLEIPVTVGRPEAVDTRTVNVTRIELDGEGNPIREATGQKTVDPDTGEVVNEMRDKTLILGTRRIYRINKGYDFNNSLGTFTRPRTLDEALRTVPSRPIVFTSYRKRSPPSWLADRGVN